MSQASPVVQAATTPAGPAPVCLAMRFLCHLSAVNPERLALSPRDDWQATARTGLAVAASFLFTTLMVSAALYIALGDSAPIWALVPIAALMAAMVILIDHAIIQSHWFQMGLESANARNGELRLPGESRARRIAAGLVRVALSFVLAFTLAGFADLLVYQRDIMRKIEENNRAANSAVFASAARFVDKAIAGQVDDIARLSESIKVSQSKDAALESLINARDAQALDRLKALRGELSEQHVKANQAAQDAIAERTGVIDNPSNSGIVGKGRRYDAATARRDLAMKRVGEIEAEVARLEKGDDKITIDSEAILTAVRSERDAMEAKRERLVEIRDGLIANRAASILAAVKIDPAYVPMQDGLVIRLAAMLELVNSPATFQQVLGLKFVIMLIEMGGLITKLLLVAPSLYSLRTALEFEVEASEIAARAHRRLAETAVEMLDAAETSDARRERRERDGRRRRNAATAREGYEDILREALASSVLRH